jgi:hypothetical protein
MNTLNTPSRGKVAHASLDPGFWRLWVVGSAISGAAGTLAGLYPGFFAGLIVAHGMLRLTGPGNDILFPRFTNLGWIVFGVMYGVVSGTILGVAVGGVQGIVLRWRLSRASLWTVASAGGAVVGGILSGAAVGTIARSALPVWYVALGAMVGLAIAQWRVFRQRTSHAGSWVLTSAASLFVTLAVSYGVVCVGAQCLCR